MKIVAVTNVKMNVRTGMCAQMGSAEAIMNVKVMNVLIANNRLCVAWGFSLSATELPATYTGS